jgi:hypothetical protein
VSRPTPAEWKAHFEYRDGWLYNRATGARAGSQDADGYWKLGWRGKTWRYNRAVWVVCKGRYPHPGMEIDHRNGVRSDNRIVNLRETTHALNSQNKKVSPTSTSKAVGVSWYAKTGKWRAAIKVDGKSQHIGYFDTEQQAIDAYQERKAEIHRGMMKGRY